MSLFAIPVTRDEANAFVESFHRHNKRVASTRFSLGASDGNGLVGIAMVGNPVARELQDGVTAEVTRVCVSPDAPKGCSSFLYAACWRAWRAMGGQRLVTYTLQSESGASLRGSGAKLIARLPPRKPGGWQNRPGREWQAVVGQGKFRWGWGA